jgi:hypothetical protein
MLSESSGQRFAHGWEYSAATRESLLPYDEKLITSVRPRVRQEILQFEDRFLQVREVAWGGIRQADVVQDRHRLLYNVESHFERSRR